MGVDHLNEALVAHLCLRVYAEDLDESVLCAHGEVDCAAVVHLHCLLDWSSSLTDVHASVGLPLNTLELIIFHDRWHREADWVLFGGRDAVKDDRVVVLAHEC